MEVNVYKTYEYVKELGKGNFGVARLVRNLNTGQYLAIKFLPRGDRVDKNVEQEVINLRSLRHPNVIGFKEVLLTDKELCIVMEFAAGGQLFDRICKATRFGEDEARYFFQQLVAGMEYVHQSGVCHRDLKLENVLLDGSPAPLLKICDFGYSKSVIYESQPKSTVGTPAYIAPEVLEKKQYNGSSADIWSAAVSLYVMLVGRYPFEDESDPHNFRKTIVRILHADYRIPSSVRLSESCTDILRRMLCSDPTQRITIAQIKQHPWFLMNAHEEVINGYPNTPTWPESHQSVEDIRHIIATARLPLGQVAAVPEPRPMPAAHTADMMDEDADATLEDMR